jgi:hypothetical protein
MPSAMIQILDQRSAESFIDVHFAGCLSKKTGASAPVECFGKIPAFGAGTSHERFIKRR